MSRIQSKNTKPEIAVRTHLYSKGVRYRLHNKHLPGKPDITIGKLKTAIFVHGCFWHHHNDCKRASWPKTNKDYWKMKIVNNITRDNQNIQSLMETGWNNLIIWECEIKVIKDNKKLNIVIDKYNNINKGIKIV